MEKTEAELPIKHQLKSNYLSFSETIAQSFANIAPTLTPALSIPLVAASAGDGTWLVYLVSMIGLSIVGKNITVFAKRVATPGALYTYVKEGLGSFWGFGTGWAMMAAYLGTAMAVLVGFSIFAQLLATSIGIHIPEVLWLIIGISLVWYLAYKDIRLSAKIALIMEFGSVGLIVILGLVVFFAHGIHLDTNQIALKNVSFSGLALGMVLTVFSYVGFESSATLGRESKNPHRTIPRAVRISLMVAGIFFISLSYIEVMGFPGGLSALEKSSSPLNQMATAYNVPWFGLLTDFGATISLFSCTLASVNAGSRILFSMSQDQHFHNNIGISHSVNKTPHIAVNITSGIVLVATLLLSNTQALNAYGYFGTYATYGFIFAYIMISIAAPLFLKSINELKAKNIINSSLSIIFLLIPLVGSVYPVPSAPYNLLPYLFLVYMAGGYSWYLYSNRKTNKDTLLLTNTNLESSLTQDTIGIMADSPMIDPPTIEPPFIQE